MTDPEQTTQPEVDREGPDDDAAAETRREALRRLGKLAAYTAPALLAMLSSSRRARMLVLLTAGHSGFGCRFGPRHSLRQGCRPGRTADGKRARGKGLAKARLRRQSRLAGERRHRVERGTSLARTTGSDQSNQTAPGAEIADGEAPAETRREAVRRLGKYAAYTAPALLALLTATTAASGDSIPP